MMQEFDYHIWSEQSPVTVSDILIANGHAHGINPSPNDINIFEQKIIKSYYGPAVLAYATPKGNPTIVCGAVAYGVYQISIGQRVVKGGIAYANFVVPEFQGKGVFKRLVQFAQQQCKDRDYSILISFPNANSLAGYKSAGWAVPSGLLKYMARPASVKSVFRWLLNFRDLRKSFKGKPAESNSINECAESISRLYGSGDEPTHSIPENLAWPVRSEGFYRWRLCDLQQSNFGLEQVDDSFVIYRRGYRGKLREIQLIDFRIKGSSRRILKKLLGRIATRENADILSLKISKTHPYFSLFKQGLFFSLGRNKNLNFAYLILDESIDGKELAWAIAGLDFHMV